MVAMLDWMRVPTIRSTAPERGCPLPKTIVPSSLPASFDVFELNAAIAASHGVDVLFAPSAAEMYPDGFATTVRVNGLGSVLEGAERGPELWTVVAALPRDEALRRIDAAL